MILKDCDIVLRNSGAVGWLGLLIDEFGNEIYRTGKHWPCANDAFTQVKLWAQKCGCRPGECESKKDRRCRIADEIGSLEH